MCANVCVWMNEGAEREGATDRDRDREAERQTHTETLTETDRQRQTETDRPRLLMVHLFYLASFAATFKAPIPGGGGGAG